ncbi:MAG: DNA-directed RNA polymerase specialized sigma24 family protein [Rhodothermales bacterium]|jgi:DNA-directed RNA polymerase specialized sigma24 family protein
MKEKIAGFRTTRWSVVLQASGPAESAPALSLLCEQYWYPLYAFARHRGYSAADAEDHTQGFFVYILERNAFAKADRERGRFRTFLLVSFRSFLMHARERASAKRRGGDQHFVYLDAEIAERRYLLEPADERSPDRVYDRCWAMTILDGVMKQLSSEAQRNGSEERFELLKPWLTGNAHRHDYGTVATALDCTEAALRVAVHRLRARYGKLLREAVLETVADESEVPGELRHLLASLRM